VAVSAPTEEERSQPYLWRFSRHIPGRGRFELFDRSWYGRVLVERVEGLAAKPDWMRAYTEINDFEQVLVQHRIEVLKFWLAVSQDEQLKRFRQRQKTPLKRFKITPEDWRNRKKWAVEANNNLELDVLADRFDSGGRAQVVLLAAGRARDADAAKERAARLDHQPPADRRHARPVPDAALRPPRLRRLRKLGRVGAEAHRGISLGARHVRRVRPGEALAQQHLHHAHAVDHRHCDLVAAIAALLERGLRGLQRGIRRQYADRESALRLHHGRPQKQGQTPFSDASGAHFFFMKKVNSLLLSSCDRS
jgi:hypothetical protein